MLQSNSMQITYDIEHSLAESLSKLKCFDKLVIDHIVSLKYLKIDINSKHQDNNILKLSNNTKSKLYFKGVGLFTSRYTIGNTFGYNGVIKLFFNVNSIFRKYIKIFTLIYGLHVPIIRIGKCEDGGYKMDKIYINTKKLKYILFEELNGTLKDEEFLLLFDTIGDLDIFLIDVENRIKKMNRKVIHNNLHLGHIGYIKKKNNIQTYFLDFKNAEIISTLDKEKYNKIKNNDIAEFKKIRYHLLEEFIIDKFNRKNRLKLPVEYHPFVHCFNNFEILEHIGSGAFGDVYIVKIKFVDKSLYQNIKHDKEKEYALKIYDSLFLRMETMEGEIPVEELENLEFNTFIDEELELSMLMSDLNIGPKIIDIFTCYDIHNIGDKLNFMLMEKLDGTLMYKGTNIIDNVLLKLTKKELEELFENLYTKIKKMNKYIVHNDLHFANVGYKIDHNRKPIPYIIDYGLSIKKDGDINESTKDFNEYKNLIIDYIPPEENIYNINRDFERFDKYKKIFMDEWNKQKSL